MKKIFLNESEKQKYFAEKEKMILESFAKTYNKIKRVDENEIKGFEEEKPLNFDTIFDKIFSMEPEYDYDETSPGYLSSGRDASDGNMIATFYDDELPISLTITYNNHWEEDEDGPGYWGYLNMSYDNLDDSVDAKLDDMLAKFGEQDLINYSKTTGHGGTTVEEVKYYNMINTEFMNLLSDETKEKLYKQIESLIEKNAKYQRFD